MQWDFFINDISKGHNSINLFDFKFIGNHTTSPYFHNKYNNASSYSIAHMKLDNKFHEALNCNL